MHLELDEIHDESYKNYAHAIVNAIDPATKSYNNLAYTQIYERLTNAREICFGNKPIKDWNIIIGI